VTEEKIEIKTTDGTSDGFFYRPDGGDRYPGIVYYTDIGGIRPASQDMARRLAAEGYAVLQPNVFYRTSKPPVFGVSATHGEDRMKRFAELSAPLTEDAMSSDASAYVAFLEAQKSVKPGAMGVVGYCFTGKMALYTAKARPDKIAAVASFHGGGLVTDGPGSPHLALPSIKARLYFGHAINERSMPAEAIAKLDRALEAWGGKFESEVYEGAAHAWTMPDGPVYNQPQAERAYKKLTELFAETLK
jgi:carboxymethylenebutenolidase